MPLTIDTVTYNVPVIDYKRSCDFLYKYAERVESGDLKSELIGCYFNYKSLKIGSITDTATYTALWQKLTEPVTSHSITMYDEDGTYSFSCYFAAISDAIRTVHGGVPYWKGLTFDVIAISPARVP